MKISKLISKLEDIKKTHGDIIVVSHEDRSVPLKPVDNPLSGSGIFEIENIRILDVEQGDEVECRSINQFHSFKRKQFLNPGCKNQINVVYMEAWE